MSIESILNKPSPEHLHNEHTSSWWLTEKKSHLTNLVSLLFIVAGYISPYYSHVLKVIGYFALSGAVTNWLAIHMLFEKIPLLYGSGIIPAKFQDFKLSIKRLIMTQFFTPVQINKFIKEQNFPQLLEEKLATVDLEAVYNNLLAAIMQSSFGSTIALFGGGSALLPLKSKIIEKFKFILRENILPLLNVDQLNGEFIAAKTELLITGKLEELTPQMVKELIQDMMQQHLGWLVVWGGVFGGAIGGLIAFTNTL